MWHFVDDEYRLLPCAGCCTLEAIMRQLLGSTRRGIRGVAARIVARTTGNLRFLST